MDINNHEQVNIVDKLLNETTKEISTNIQKGLVEIFKQLHEKLNSNITDYVSKLKPLQHKIDVITDKEMKFLDSLKHQIPISDVQNIITLQEGTEVFLEEILDLIYEITIR